MQQPNPKRLSGDNGRPSLRQAWPDPAPQGGPRASQSRGGQPRAAKNGGKPAGIVVRYGMGAQHTPPHRSAARRRRRRQRRLVVIVLAGLIVLAAIITLVVLLLTQKPAEAPVPSEPPPVSVAPPPASELEPEPEPLPAPTREPTPYDEAAAPALYNFENPIPDTYFDTLEMENVGGGQQMETRAAKAFLDMSEAASADGLTLVPVSGYRTNAHQTNNYNASIQRYLDQGLSHDKAVELTEGYYAIPGTSEHEAGLAIDIGFIEDSFDTTPEFVWMQEHCAEYGFILRYREEDFDTTHIHYEPWHYRYVGANHAEKMAELGFTTLEEYTESLNELD